MSKKSIKKHKKKLSFSRDMGLEIENWWKQAQADLNTAKNSYESKDYYACIFWCQQATEKALKALILKELQEIKKVHDLHFLSKKLNAPESIVHKCSQLNRVYIEVRYPDASETIPANKFSNKDAQNYIQIALEILQWIEQKLFQN